MISDLFVDFFAVVRSQVSLLFALPLGGFTLGEYIVGLSVVSIVLGFLFRSLRSPSAHPRSPFLRRDATTTKEDTD